MLRADSGMVVRLTQCDWLQHARVVAQLGLAERRATCLSRSANASYSQPMVDFYPRSVEAARRAAHLARRAARNAERAATLAERAAAQRERLKLDSPEAAADLRARVAAASRRSAECQRRAEEVLLNFARRVERWAAREDAAVVLRPVFMSEVAHAAGWAGVVLTLGDHSGSAGLVAASNATARRAHEMQMTLNEGPTLEASSGRISIAQGAELKQRWPRFGETAGDLGVTSVAAVPLHFGSLSAIGPPAPDPPGDIAELRRMAEALDEVILLGPDVARTANNDLPSLDLFEQEDFQPALHQAAGVLYGRGDWSIGDAIALIRAHAYAEDRPVTEVAEDIIHGRWTP